MLDVLDELGMDHRLDVVLGGILLNHVQQRHGLMAGDMVEAGVQNLDQGDGLGQRPDVADADAAMLAAEKAGAKRIMDTAGY